MENREYIRVKKPDSPFPLSTNILRERTDQFWKCWVFYHLFSFYKEYDSINLRNIIQQEQLKPNPRIERAIAKLIRKILKNTQEFCFNGFVINGEVTNDEEREGNYDIVINHSYWGNAFHFECKNLSLDHSKNLISKYVCYNMGHKVYDGGVYRYFNGKYAQNQDFGGMLGFVLSDNLKTIKAKINEKLKMKFDTSPNGDLKHITDNSIGNNDFTFDSIHNRNNVDFILHHILFDFTSNS
ncbi:hypothetical protein [uncultured Draconibacterium sp.]|uniref:hypothetical protein n=1 Tax=uncultured Draconibacterium sp. TaxID=1573823 RepID=UPI0029C701E9|nr:hypothetical protein [uncultured Draconibacterium sp.]